jgi:hypothetical protein
MKAMTAVLVAEDIGESGHIAIIVLSGIGLKALFGDTDEDMARMVPCMTGRIVRRCRKPSIRQACLPIELPFKVLAVAADTMRLIKRIARERCAPDLLLRASRTGKRVRPRAQSQVLLSTCGFHGIDQDSIAHKLFLRIDARCFAVLGDGIDRERPFLLAAHAG